MNRYHLEASYDPDAYCSDYKYIMVGFDINKDTGFNEINGTEICHILVNKKTIDRIY